METQNETSTQEQPEESYSKFNIIEPTLSLPGYEDFDFLGI